MQKCPICGKGNLEKSKIKEYMFGIYLGEFPALVCTKCNESFTDSETTKRIEEAAKKKGVWGLSARTKITKTGNSLAIRVPKKIADYLELKDGDGAYVHPEGHKLVIEVKLDKA
jgi:YgiT-type zinc finger domain-containing protein